MATLAQCRIERQCDRSFSIEQWSLEFGKEKEVECLLDRLKSHFVNAHPALSDAQREKHKEAKEIEIL